MSRPLAAVLAVALFALVVGLGLYYWKDTHPPVLPPPPVAQAPAPPPEAPRGPANPLPPAPALEKPLPPLATSDLEVRETLASTLPPGAFERLVFDDFIRRVVATIDNLPREQYAARLNPIQPVPGVPRTLGRDETLAWSPENSTRYAPYMAALDA